jgi:16S rRNA processing protein RimM
MPPARHLQLGYVAGVHGVRGGLRVKLFNAESSTLTPGLIVGLRERSGEGAPLREYEIARAAPKPGSDLVRVWLVGVEGREAAEALRGRELWVDRAALPELDEDEFYLADLVGLEVVREREDGGFDSLGEVNGVTTNGLQDLLCVKLRGREWLLPALPPFIVAIEDARVIVDVHDDMLPEGGA